MTNQEAKAKIKKLLIAEDKEVEQRRIELSKRGVQCGGLDNDSWCKDITEKYKSLRDSIISEIDEK